MLSHSAMRFHRSRTSVNVTIQANKAKKVDIRKQGMNSVKDATVKKNLMGYSDTMKKKDWKDPQGRKGKVRVAFGARDRFDPFDD